MDNFKRLTLALVTMLALSGCGYDSIEECNLAEQKKCGENNKPCNYAAIKYCEAKFAKKTISGVILQNNTDYEIQMIGGNVTINNYSDQVIRVVKVVAARKCDDRKINWDNVPNYIAGRSIPPGGWKSVITFTDLENVAGCYWHYVST